MIKNLWMGLLFFVLCSKIIFAQAFTFPAFDVEQTKEEITIQLSKDLAGHAHTKPLLILIGGFPGAGKTTLVRSLLDAHDITVISWNAIRQALLDRRIQGSPYDGEIIDTVHENLLRICLKRHVNVVIDANAHARNIARIEQFLKAEQYDQVYRIVKICLNPPVETLFKRVCSREYKEGIHQGTESDLRRDLQSSKKKIDLDQYALVINTEEIAFETEWKIVHSYLEPYLSEQN